MSYRPLTLYYPDDDESSDGGSIGAPHAPMSVANEACGRRDSGSDRFSIDSNLLEDIDNEEFDDPMLYAAKYNPLGLRVEKGKRVGVDSDDESDGDGEHMGFDRDYGNVRAGQMRGALNEDEHSIGSDDDYAPANVSNVPKQFSRNDAEFDAMVPTSSSTGGHLFNAGEDADAFDPVAAQEAEHQKGARALAKAEKRVGTKAVESKRLVAESLAKARAVKGKDIGASAARQFYTGKAKQEAAKGGVGVPEEMKAETRAKGKKALVSLALRDGTKETAGTKLQRAMKYSEEIRNDVARAVEGKDRKQVLAELKARGAPRAAAAASGGGAAASAAVADKGVARAQTALVKEGKTPEEVKSLTTRVNSTLRRAAVVAFIAKAGKKASAANIIKRFFKDIVNTKAEAALIRQLIAKKMALEREGRSAEEMSIAQSGGGRAAPASGGGKSEASTMVAGGGGAATAVETKASSPAAARGASVANLAEGVDVGAGRMLSFDGKTLKLDGEAIRSGTTPERLEEIKTLITQVRETFKGDEATVGVLVGKLTDLKYYTQARINKAKKGGGGGGKK
jgi:hypothetical protein